MTTTEVREWLQTHSPHERQEIIDQLKRLYEDLTEEEIIKAVDTRGASLR